MMRVSGRDLINEAEVHEVEVVLGTERRDLHSGDVAVPQIQGV